LRPRMAASMRMLVACKALAHELEPFSVADTI